MLGSERARGLFGVCQLVVVGSAFEADAERLDRPWGHLAHKANDDGGVEAAAQERAERYVCDEALFDRIPHQGFQTLGCFRKLTDAVDLVRRRPVARHRAGSVAADGHPRGWRKNMYVLVCGRRRRKVPVRQVQTERFQVGGASQRRMPMESFDFGGEEQVPPVVVVEEWFLASSVTCEQESLSLDIPYCESEHTVQSSNRVLALTCDQLENDFGVAVGLKLRAVRFQLSSQLPIVVNLSVEHDRQIAGVVPHRLVGALGEVDNAKPTMPEACARGRRDAHPIRPSMREHLGHCLERRTARRWRSEVETAHDATHGPS